MSKSPRGAEPTGSSVEQTVFNEKLRFIAEEKVSDPIVVTSDTPTVKVLARMREARTSGVLITDDDQKLLGIFTGRDYLDKLAGTGENTAAPIEKYMTGSPTTLSPENTVGEAIQLMTGGGYRHVPLLNPDATIFGLLSVRDVIDFISEHFPAEVYNHPPVIHQQIETQEGG